MMTAKEIDRLADKIVEKLLEKQPDEFLTVAEAAERYSLSESFFRREQTKRLLGGVKFGKKLRYAKKNIDNYIMSLYKKISLKETEC